MDGGDDTLDLRLYRVMRSICSVLICPGVVLAVLGVAPVGMTGWKDGGGGSRLPLPSILSVVAFTLPPFRCRSHMISRRPIWGNIAATCSTSAGLAARGLVRDDEDDDDDDGADGFAKKK